MTHTKKAYLEKEYFLENANSNWKTSECEGHGHATQNMKVPKVVKIKINFYLRPL